MAPRARYLHQEGIFRPLDFKFRHHHFFPWAQQKVEAEMIGIRKSQAQFHEFRQQYNSIPHYFSKHWKQTLNSASPITSKNKSSFPRTFKSIHQVFIFLSHTFFNRFLTHEERFNQAQPRSPTLDLNGLASKVRSVLMRWMYSWFLIPNDIVIRLFWLLLSTTRTQLTHVFSHFDYTHTQ